jgi:hypothetical protein
MDPGMRRDDEQKRKRVRHKFLDPVSTAIHH